jgi:alkylation response protein AidB-like acyl-CoA dehydrogenase
MMEQLPQERLIIACGAVGAMEGAVARTIAYCKEREAFGGPLTAVPEHPLQAGRMPDQDQGGARLSRRVHRRASAGAS